MVQMTVRLAAVSGRAHQLVQALQMRMRETLRQGRCFNAHIGVDVDEANAFWYYEDWQNVGALEAELRTERFSQLLALMETSAQPPVLEFRMITETRRLEYVAAVREAAESTER